jgi:hypothetical protein
MKKAKPVNPEHPHVKTEGDRGTGSKPPAWTPGQWLVERGNVGGENPLFVTAAFQDGFRPWSDADAHLIAAAPELYEALRDCMAACELSGADSSDFFHAREAAYAALAKARGEAVSEPPRPAIQSPEKLTKRKPVKGAQGVQVRPGGAA